MSFTCDFEILLKQIDITESDRQVGALYITKKKTFPKLLFLCPGWHFETSIINTENHTMFSICESLSLKVFRVYFHDKNGEKLQLFILILQLPEF